MGAQPGQGKPRAGGCKACSSSGTFAQPHMKPPALLQSCPPASLPPSPSRSQTNVAQRRKIPVSYCRGGDRGALGQPCPICGPFPRSLRVPVMVRGQHGAHHGEQNKRAAAREPSPPGSLLINAHNAPQPGAVLRGKERLQATAGLIRTPKYAGRGVDALILPLSLAKEPSCLPAAGFKLITFPLEQGVGGNKRRLAGWEAW